MPFQIDPDESLPEDVRRLAAGELDAALRDLAEPEALGLEETVHGVRKRCKKLRGLIRLVRPGLGGVYREVNIDVRDAARELGPLRDAHAVLGTFDDLIAATHGDRLPDATLSRVRSGLVSRVQRAEQADAHLPLRRAAERLQRVRDGLGRWDPDDDHAIALAGLTDNYARARTAYRASLADPTDEALHEWRRRAKYGWHHATLLHPLAPGILGQFGVQLKDLSDGLGDDHDLAVLRAAILGAPEEFGPQDGGTAIALMDAVRADLQDRCRRAGARLHAESPRAFRRRIGRYWKAWDAVGRERPVGELSDLATHPADRPPVVEDLVADPAGA